MRYEKRENILEAAPIRQLLTMGKLVLALAKNDEGMANALWPEVLSFDFWHIPTSTLWQLSWHVNDAARDEKLTWSKALLASEKQHFMQPALLMLALAGHVGTETCEQMLDYLIGTEPLATHEEHQGATIRSPFRAFYTGETVQRTNPELFYDTVSHLTVLRAKLRDYAASQPEALTLTDLITFVAMYEEAEERMLNTSPYNQQADAVQLMTVFKAKGLEFDHVFLPSCQDEIWGSSSRGNSNKLTLPPNLAPIRHAGATDDERLRILFVAITRAKCGLHLASFAKTYTGKDTKHLKYLNEQQQDDGSVRSLVLPEHASVVQASDHAAPTLASLELNWRHRHVDGRDQTALHSLLEDRIRDYRLSPTHLTQFVDLEYGGPEAFFFNALLRFPQAPSVHSQFGNAIHTTLEWVQHRTAEEGEAPSAAATNTRFALELQKYKLTAAQYELERERGEKALAAYLTARGHTFQPGDKAEQNFRNEGVFVGDAHLAGKVDKMEINHERKTITVIDYKTGKSYPSWKPANTKLHKYELQLYAYKMLIEGSHTYKGYTVDNGRLEFVEPDNDGHIQYLELPFDTNKAHRVAGLIQAMWHRVCALDFPDVSEYDTTLSGIKAFEDDLLNSPEKSL
jgi:DNA helicase-2/ATP-dependent DNA helicase PcrA